MSLINDFLTEGYAVYFDMAWQKNHLNNAPAEAFPIIDESAQHVYRQI